jgi:hypothetical protein
MSKEPLDCNEIDDLIHSYLDEELTPDVRGRFEHHLAWCARCRAAVRAMQQTISLIEGLVPASPPPHFDDPILASLGLERRRLALPAWLVSRPARTRVAWALAALVLLTAPLLVVSHSVGAWLRGNVAAVGQAPKAAAGLLSALGNVPGLIMRWWDLYGLDTLWRDLSLGAAAVGKTILLELTNVNPLVSLTALLIALSSTLLLLRSLGSVTVHLRRIHHETHLML